MAEADEECQERRLAELEFVAAAYDPEQEAWHDINANGYPVVHRQIPFQGKDDENSIMVRLSLTMPPTYPLGVETLEVTARLGEEISVSDPRLRKCVLNALPHLVAIAQQAANESVGVEAIFTVLSRVEEWVFQGSWEEFYKGELEEYTDPFIQKQIHAHPVTVTLGRRLIYSHHIISKVKRADIKALAVDYQLGGYMKVGWPGILIIEGREDDCIAFCDTIRRWNWQYLVVRGEQQDSIVVFSSNDQALQAHRKFNSFQEVEDMSIVAQHCRNVGLEALFRTSMKVYDNSSSKSDDESSDNDNNNGNKCTILYGALIHVDHMNDPKGYRKWLRKTAKETECHLMVKQCYSQDDYSKRPIIMVGIVAPSSNYVAAFLKRWRTSRVDVDSRGKACLERKMTVVAEGVLSPNLTVNHNCVDWEKAMAEDSVTSSEILLSELLQHIGGASWKDSFQNTFPNT